jgi:CheY-like chemotaxis protein/HPt (histidine-containing phosphotransfer) domain-containing protein
MLGGDITVSSQLGIGSVFTLTLPVDPGLARTTTPARLVTRSGLIRPEEPEAARLDGRVILLIDDSEDNRRIVGHFLSRGGASVVEAMSLAEAFAQLDAVASIGLVLTDLQLPDGDGLDIVRSLRARGDLRPVVALTADAMLETREVALTAGVDDFMVKPVIGNRLVARVAALLSRTDSRTEARPADRRPADSGALRRKSPRTSQQLPRPGLTRHPTAPSLAAIRTPPKPHVAGLSAELDDRQRAALTEPSVRPKSGVPATTPPDVPEELLQRFYVVLAERVYALEDAVRAKERVRIRDVAHRVAGSGSTMGHPELTDLGRALEQLLGDGTPWESIEPAAQRFLTAAREAAARRPWLTAAGAAGAAPDHKRGAAALPRGRGE